MARVRVVRILEYVYDTPEVAARDMAMWHVGANATKSVGDPQPFLTISSAVIVHMSDPLEDLGEGPNTD